MLTQLLRLWSRRLLWILLGIAATTVIVYLPSGYLGQSSVRFPQPPVMIPREGTYLVEPLYRYQKPAMTWTFERYRINLKYYFYRLRHGDIRLVTPDGSRTGYSVQVREVIAQTWGVSMRLFLPALLLGIVGGGLIGLVASRSAKAERFLRPTIMFGLSIPDFLLMILLWLLSLWVSKQSGFTLLPVGFKGPGAAWQPTVLLCIFPVLYTTRLTMNIALEIKAEDFIRTAYAKGASNVRVLFRHTLRAALPRVLNGLPLVINVTMSSIILFEHWFDVRGLGWHLTKVRDLEMAVTFGAILCIWAVVMDGLVQTVRLVVNPLLREVGE